MKVVVIGDISWRHQYHLGDEAMTEAAIHALQARDISDILLIAGDPQVATEFYGLPAVPRVGFHSTWSRDRLQSTLDAVTSSLASDIDAPGAEIRREVAAADAVLIAGGGNMNSDHVHHLFERAALTRVARHYGKPLFVTSQTVGPHLNEMDLPLVTEILEYATCFGAREADTHRLLLSLGGDPARVFLGQDDALLLSPQLDDYLAEHPLDGDVFVGSFTMHAGSSGLGQSYADRVTESLDRIADAHGATVALLPHLGSLDPSVRKGDQSLNDRVAAASKTGRLISMPMPTARQAIAVTQQARLSLSTRYHPTVFSPAVGTPAIGIALSEYSTSRMGGALTHYGLQDFCIPTEAWLSPIFDEVVQDALKPRVTDQITKTAPLARQSQEAWWDSLVAALKRGTWVSPSPARTPPRLRGGVWAEHLDLLRPYSAELNHERTIGSQRWREIVDLEKSLAASQTRVAALEAERDVLRSQRDRARNRRIVRIVDRLKKPFG